MSASTWRSLLFVPVNVRKFVESAPRRGADAIQLDLEDSVASSEKEAARKLVEATANEIARNGYEGDVLVRVNRPLSLAVRDIEASVGPHVAALALPKVDGPGHLRLLDELCAEREAQLGLAEGHTKFVVMVETARAAFAMDRIARASARTVAMTLGTEDFATDLGIHPEPDVLLPHKMALVAACAAARVQPLGLLGTIAEFRDIEAFRTVAERSRRVGMRGAGCVHPNQVKILNETFSPTQDELAWARQVVDAYDAAHASGSGAIVVAGKMVDVPMAVRAKKLLAWNDTARSPRKDRS